MIKIQMGIPTNASQTHDHLTKLLAIFISSSRQMLCQVYHIGKY